MLKKLFGNKKAKYLIGVIIILVGCYFLFFNKKDEKQKDETIAKKQAVSLLKLDEFNNQTTKITAIGTVESQEQVELKSEISSTIQKINVSLGDEVKKGQVLIELNHKTFDAQLQQAGASIGRVQGNLEQQLAGATDESIEQSLASIKQAEANLAQANAQLENTLISNENKIENARLTLEQARLSLLNIDETASQNSESVNNTVQSTMLSTTSTIRSLLLDLTALQYKYFSCLNSVFCTNVNSSKALAIFQLFGVSNAGRYNTETVSALSGGLITAIENNTILESELEIKLSELITGLNSLKSALIKLRISSNSSLGLNMTDADKLTITNAISSVDTTIATLVSGKNSIDSAVIGNKTNLDNTKSQFQKAEENYEAIKKQAQEDKIVSESLVISREASVEQAKASYDASISGPREVDLLGTRAGVREAQASYNLVAANRAKAFIKAPFDGVISILPVKLGELVSPGSRMIGIVNDGGLQVSAYINERDRALIKIGGSVLIEEDVIATISHIAPSIDPQTRKVRVIASINKPENLEEENNPTPLLISQFVKAQFEINKSTDKSYLLPLASIKTTTRGTYVFVAKKQDENFIIEQKEIVVGRIIGESIEVSSGLESINEIVAFAQGLKEGQQVKVMK